MNNQKSWKQKQDLVIQILLIISIFVSAIGFLEDIKNTVQYGGVDLRNKVVGSRLLKQKIDPYFYKWQTGDPVELLDPRDKVQYEVSMVTVPPSVLLLGIPFATIPYNIQRFIWFVIQWLLLLLSLYLFSRTTTNIALKKLVWIVGLFLISSSFFWRLHVERGQIYILYVSLISLAYFLHQSNFKNNLFWSGFILGISVILRAPLALLVLPFLLYKKWKLFSGAIIGGISALGISLLFSGWKVWLSYFEAMRKWGIIHQGNIPLEASSSPFQNIEGIRNLYELANIPIADSSLQFLFKSIGIIVPGIVLMLLFLFLLVLVFMILWKRKTQLYGSQLFLLGSVFVYLSDLFLPAARFSYNNVMFLPILAIVILESERFSFLSTGNIKKD